MIAPSLSEKAQPLIELDLEAAAFASDWKHCDQIANYLARLASFDRDDTFLYSNLFSTVLNELLEIVFFQHRNSGRLNCAVMRDGTVDRIEFRIPVDADSRDFYRQGVADAQSDSADHLYTSSFLGAGEPSRAVGFLELAADYDAEIWLDDDDSLEDRLRLVVDVRLEESLIAQSSPSRS